MQNASNARMPASIKKLWINALRSGEYKKATGRLQKGIGFCCLGVLECVLEGEVEKDYEGLSLTAPTEEFYVRYDIDLEDQEGKLIDLNDDRLLSFDQIADYIEEHVEGEE